MSMQTYPKSTPVVVESLRGRDLLSLADLTPDEFGGLLDSALTLKQGWKTGDRPRLLEHKTLAMIFEKQSLRTQKRNYNCRGVYKASIRAAKSVP